MLSKRIEKVENRERRIIKEGNAQEPSPWLERTKWPKYLRSLDRDDLLRSIATPDVDEDPEAYAIWKTMMKLMQHCQRTVDEHAGVFIRKEVMRTEEEQSRFVPLKGYQDANQIQSKGRHWQQLLMFFVRTQRSHSWKSPQYRLTQRQREAFERLMEATQDEVNNRPPSDRPTPPRPTSSAPFNIRLEDDIWDDAEDWAFSSDDEDIQPAESAIAPWDLRSLELTTGIERALLGFCMALICQKSRLHEYENALVCALAVLGIEPQGWKGVDLYPPILSSVIKVARFMIVQYAFDETVVPGEDEMNGHKGMGMFTQDKQTRNEEDEPFTGRRDTHQNDINDSHHRGGCIEMITDIVNAYVLRKSHSPMEWMLDLRTFGMKIHFSGTVPGYVQWAGDQLLYKNIQFTMSQFRWMVHQLASDCRERLLRKILDVSPRQEQQLPVIPWDQLRDDPANAQPGWSFVSDRRNPWPVNGEWWLFDRLIRSGQYQLLRPEAEARWNVAEVQRLLSEIYQLDEDLLVLHHFTSGAPGRATEVLSIRANNTPIGGYRNVGIDNGLFFTVTRYHKGYSMNTDVKIIHRYLPSEVGALFVYRLWLVRPLQQRLEAEIYHLEVRSSFIWPRWHPSGRGFSSDGLREALKRVSRQYLGSELHIASTRHVMIAISRRYLRRSHQFGYDNEEDELNEADKDRDDTIEEQAGHGASVAWAIYARGLDERDGEMANKREQFRQSSVYWHHWLGFESTWQDKRTLLRKAPFEHDDHKAHVARWRELQAVNIDLALEKFIGARSCFRGIQRPAIQAVMRGDPRVLAIMGTGGGKSLIFMLPAWCGAGQGGLTVVVVPLIALRRDMMRRCRESGLECVEWGGSQCPDGADILLVTPEATQTSTFYKFMARMKASQRLQRITVDEAHIVMNKQRNFRRKLQELGELNRYGVQIIMLTATLPVVMEDEFRRRMGIDQAGVSIFRTSTTRNNVAYRIHRLRTATGIGHQQSRRKKQQMPGSLVGTSPVDNDERSFLAHFIQQQIRIHAGGKVVVYCFTVAETKALAEMLGCDAYHHHAKHKDEKMRAFQSGERSVMICTSAFGMGIDISDIRVIIHVGTPRSLLEYAQESGRAGRDGNASEAIIVLPREESRSSEAQRSEARAAGREKSDDVARRLMWDFIEASCQREVLDRYMDGCTTREGCGSDEQPCHGCLRKIQVNEQEHSEMVSATHEADRDRGHEDDREVRGSQNNEEVAGSQEGEESEESEESEENEESEEGEEGEEGEENNKSYGPNSSVSLGQKRSADEDWVDQRTFRQQQFQQQQLTRDWAQRQRQARQAVEQLRAVLERMQGRCVYCMYTRHHSDGHTSVFHCREAGVRNIRDLYNRLKTAIRQGREMARFSGCWYCFVPQAWCRRWVVKSSTNGGGYRMNRGDEGQTIRCQFEDLVLSIIATAMVLTYCSTTSNGRRQASPTYINQLLTRMSQEGRDLCEQGELIQYFSQAAGGGGLETNRLIHECWDAWQYLIRLSEEEGSIEQVDDSTFVSMMQAI